jgi:glyoxylase-like metal-dependent hydrolase (beta-lactamase superfamily II)
MGAEEMRGFALADAPAVAVTRDTAIALGARRVELLAVPGAHTAGDIMVWLPADSVLFAGDVLVEDGLTMLVDGGSAALLGALARIDSLGARVAVPGHGRIAAPPGSLVMRTRCALLRSRAAMRAAVEAGTPLSRVLAALPPADAGRPLSPASRERRNAVRIHQEMERELMSSSPPIPAEPRCAP